MKRITRKDLRRLYEPAPQSLYDGIHEALADLPEGKGKKKVKKKISTGFILAAALLALSAVGFAATRLNLFSSMTRYANSIVPLDGAEELVETDLGHAENEWATVTVEEAAYDGQGVMVLAKITPKEPEKYALFNSLCTDPGEEFITSSVPVELPEGTQATGDLEIINGSGAQALYIAGKEVPIPEGREAAEASDCPVYREDGKLYYTFQNEFRVEGRRDGKEILGFETSLYTAEDGAGCFSDGMTVDALAQEDGSVLLWCDGYAEETLPDALDLNLRVTLWMGDDMRSLNIPFTLVKSESERVARYVPEGDGWIGDHVKVREVNVSFTKVRAYLTVEYEYEEQLDEPMGVWLHPYDAEGNAITTGSGSCGGPGDEEGLDFYRQQEEMQSFDEIPDVIVLDAKVIDGESLGQCVCRLAKAE